MTLTDAQKDAIVREVYLIFREHRSDQNWFRNEPAWDNLGEDEQGWWRSYIATILHKVSLETKSAKSKE